MPPNILVYLKITPSGFNENVTTKNMYVSHRWSCFPFSIGCPKCLLSILSFSKTGVQVIHMSTCIRRESRSSVKSVKWIQTSPAYMRTWNAIEISYFPTEEKGNCFSRRLKILVNLFGNFLGARFHSLFLSLLCVCVSLLISVFLFSLSSFICYGRLLYQFWS